MVISPSYFKRGEGMSVTWKITTFCILIGGSALGLWALTGKWMEEGMEPEADGSNEYAIVLGAKVNGEVPSLSLHYRIDAALEYAKQYPHVKLVLSGGQGPDEMMTEAEAMRRQLVEHGIEEERLILEEESTTTYENLVLSKKLIPESVESVTIITSDYHLARARMLAEKIGFQSTDSIAANTPKVVETKLKTRERLALLKTVLFGE